MPPSSQRAPSWSPQMGAEFPSLEGTPATPMPKLGRGISEGDDVLFFDESPPPRPKLSALAEAKKVSDIFFHHLNLHSVGHDWSCRLYTSMTRKDSNSFLLIMIIRVKGILSDDGINIMPLI